ncbi:MAG: nitroreductase family protein [Bacilli bacterium]
MDIINKRRSVRQFLPTALLKEQIEALLKAAMQAPSAKNEQPWRFIVLTSRDDLTKIADFSPSFKMLKDAPAAIVLLIDYTLLTSPTMVVQDMAAATQNILLEATAQELGSCWLGVYGRPERMEAIRHFFNLASSLEPFSMIALGHPLNQDVLTYVDRYNQSRITWM